MSLEILTRMLSLVTPDTEMKLPPNMFFDMEGEFIEFIEGN